MFESNGSPDRRLIRIHARKHLSWTRRTHAANAASSSVTCSEKRLDPSNRSKATISASRALAVSTAFTDRPHR